MTTYLWFTHRLILNDIQANPGATAYEIGQRHNIDESVVLLKLRDLLYAGHVNSVIRNGTARWTAVES